MDSSIIQRLFASFTELEAAIHSARATLESKPSIPQEVIARLNSYDGILSKQRNLAEKLCVLIEKGDWDEVSRHVSLINGLSAMIRDDARAILSALSANGDEVSPDDDMSIC
jgi:hypothetical protein